MMSCSSGCDKGLFMKCVRVFCGGSSMDSSYKKEVGDINDAIIPEGEMGIKSANLSL